MKIKKMKRRERDLALSRRGRGLRWRRRRGRRVSELFRTTKAKGFGAIRGTTLATHLLAAVVALYIVALRTGAEAARALALLLGIALGNAEVAVSVVAVARWRTAVAEGGL